MLNFRNFWSLAGLPLREKKEKKKQLASFLTWLANLRALKKLPTFRPGTRCDQTPVKTLMHQIDSASAQNRCDEREYSAFGRGCMMRDCQIEQNGTVVV